MIKEGKNVRYIELHNTILKRIHIVQKLIIIVLTLICLTGEGHGLALLEDRLLSGSSGSSTLLMRPTRAVSILRLCTGDDGAVHINIIHIYLQTHLGQLKYYSAHNSWLYSSPCLSPTKSIV